MSNLPDWNTDPDSWDSLIASGDNGQSLTLPGVLTKLDPVRKYKSDKQSGAGTQGGTISLLGEELPTISIELTIWKIEQLNELKRVIDVLAPEKKAQIPRDYAHPLLAFHGIRSLVWDDMKGPSLPDASGMIKYSMEFTKFQQKKKSATNVASTPDESEGVASVYSTNPNSSFSILGYDVPTDVPPSAKGSAPSFAYTNSKKGDGGV